MRIGLLGYGKMGRAIEKIAQERGHEIVFRVDLDSDQKLSNYTAADVDVVIEFSSPHSAYENLKNCMKQGFKTVSGTTGWLEHKAEIQKLCKDNQAAFFYSSNYSIGVNLFFKLNKVLAGLLAPKKQYEISPSEIHHPEKLDPPGGTAITLAEGIIENNPEKKTWVNNEIPKKDEIAIWSSREGKVPGTHAIKYISDVDELEIKHTAYSRQGFALGAVIAAEWLADKTGVFGMDDMLKL